MDKYQHEESVYQESLESEVRRLREENKKLKEEVARLKKEVSDAGWEREAAHADDWRKPVEMGML